MSKKNGIYYTPKPIADFMVRYILKQIKTTDISVLEPSVGAGIFIESLIENIQNKFKEKSITLIDINKEELLKAKEKFKLNSGFNKKEILNDDFLKFQKRCIDKYSLIIGNPPYINKKLLTEETIKLCEAIHNDSDLSKRSINNIWTSFVVGSIKLLDTNGILAFVLPSDVLQVKYAGEIRELLEKAFKRIEIFTLKTSDFPEIEQQTVILIAYKNISVKGIYFFNINDIIKGKVTQISSNGLMIHQTKWTHYNLSSDDIKLLNRLTLNMPKISDFVHVAAGIVTGANKYFIQTQPVIRKYDLDRFALPILQNSSHTNNTVEFTNSNFKKLVKTGKPTFLISIDKNSRLSDRNRDYIKIGEEQNLNKRYKCSLRNKWYCVPNISSPPEAFFFKRCHYYPKLFKNSSNVYVTDTAYKINPKKNVSISSFVYSFYNLITLIYAELMGRKYGGGVLELTPNEFKDLPMFYRHINRSSFNQFFGIAEKHDDIFSILGEKEKYLFLDFDKKVTKKEILQLEKIYNKLIDSRISAGLS